MTSLSADVTRRVRHFGDFVTAPLAIVFFARLAGLYCLYLILLGVAAWTLLEYLVHRIVFHRYASVGQRLHQLHHEHPNDPDSERSSLSTPLIAFPIGYLLIRLAGVEAGSAIFAGLLLGYLAFIVVHHAVHRCAIEPNSWLYSAKMRHLAHHRFENCNYGVTTIFWDVVFRTSASKHDCRRPGFRSLMKVLERRS
jgi:sterol desaturase/sphingolipid hydroxylase (fatty acid hydroxylase superfamily)